MFLDPKASPRRKHIRIMVVDDHAGSRTLVKGVLTQSGYTSVTVCEHGAVALKRLNNGEKFDLIISDWNMPTMTGIELLEKIRESPDFGEIPLVMLTAQQDQSEVVMAFTFGVTDYVIKPFTPEVLLNKVTKILKRLGLE